MTIHIDLSSAFDETPEQDQQVPEVILGECRGCGRENPTVDMFPSMGSLWLCGDCSAECSGCDTRFYLNSGSPHAEDGDSIYCGSCTRDDWFSCANCSGWFTRDDYISFDYSMWCPYCAENCLEWCDDHDCYHWNDSPCDYQTGIHDYGYRPDPKFHALDSERDSVKVISTTRNNIARKYMQIPFMGFELEVEAMRGIWNDGVAVFTDEDICYLKQDGSLNNGFEIVTHPMTLAWAMERFPWQWIEQLDRLGFEGWDAGTAGLHIHISRDGFSSESHQMKFIHFIVQNERFMSWIAGRECSRWASFDKGQLSQLSRKLRHQQHADRYQAVNVQNQNTLEVRIFQSSLNVDRLKMCLQVVDAICNYTDALTASDIVTGNGIHWGSLLAWTAGQSRYDKLNEFVTNNKTILQDGFTEKVEW